MEEKPQPVKIPESDEEEYEKVIKLLEERLVKHDENRKTTQGKFEGFRNRLTKQVDGLEERINRELGEKFTSEEDRLQAALNELRGNSTTISALQKAKPELSVVQSYEIIENKKSNNDITALCELKTERRTVPEDVSVGLDSSEVNSSTNNPPNATEKNETSCDPGKLAEERERLIELLKERLQTHDDNKKAAQDKLHEICEGLRTQIAELEDRVNKELEGKFTSEDNRLQTSLNELRGNRTLSALQKAKAELLVFQSYDIIENKKVEAEKKVNHLYYYDFLSCSDEYYFDDDDKKDENDSAEPNFDLTTLYELKAERRIVPELTKMRKPTNVRMASITRGIISVQFTCLNPDEERVLVEYDFMNLVRYKCVIFKKGNEQDSKEYPLDKDGDNNSSFAFTPDNLEAETTYGVRVKMAVGDSESEWSDEVAEFTTPEFKECCVWKKCLDGVDKKRKYNVDVGNPRVAKKAIGSDNCTIIGNTYIPLNTVTSWSVKVLKSGFNDGSGTFIGVAPSDINQNVNDNYNKCGWYFSCYRSVLDSGSPYNYNSKEYGPRKGYGQYVHTGDSIGVVMDTTKGDLSFVLDGVNLGVAYEGIPLDKPLVPCVLLLYEGGSVELII